MRTRASTGSQPQHLGPNAQALEDQGVATERGDENRRRKGANDNREQLKAELANINRRIAAVERIQRIVAAVEKGYQRFEQSTRPEPQGPDRKHAVRSPMLTDRRQLPCRDCNRKTPGIIVTNLRRRPLRGAKAPSMPDDLSKQQEHAAQQDADRQKKAQDDEQARQDKAARTKPTACRKLRDEENRRIEQLAKQNADRRLPPSRANAPGIRAPAHQSMVRKRAVRLPQRGAVPPGGRAKAQRGDRTPARLEEKAKEGPIRDAAARYAQALGQHYDLRDPYASLAKSAMAEYAAFRRDREAYDRQIAKTADPIERQALDLRKRIEGADYLAMTGDRIAKCLRS